MLKDLNRAGSMPLQSSVVSEGKKKKKKKQKKKRHSNSVVGTLLVLKHQKEGGAISPIADLSQPLWTSSLKDPQQQQQQWQQQQQQ